jgi:hypothetical protein
MARGRYQINERAADGKSRKRETLAPRRHDLFALLAMFRRIAGKAGGNSWSLTDWEESQTRRLPGGKPSGLGQ